jgi:hypothetical protein
LIAKVKGARIAIIARGVIRSIGTTGSGILIAEVNCAVNVIVAHSIIGGVDTLSCIPSGRTITRISSTSYIIIASLGSVAAISIVGIAGVNCAIVVIVASHSSTQIALVSSTDSRKSGRDVAAALSSGSMTGILHNLIGEHNVHSLVRVHVSFHHGSSSGGAVVDNLSYSITHISGDGARGPQPVAHLSR